MPNFIGRAAVRVLAQRLLASLTLLVACFGWQVSFAQSFLQASGPKIVNASSQEVILKGVNLGGWQVQEGYMMKPGYSGTQGSIKQYLYSQGQSDGQVESFYQQWRDNFFTKADIDYLKDKGFNCVRLPLHYELFLTASQRAVRTGVSKGSTSYGDYLNSLRSWYTNNQLFTDPTQQEGVRLIDEVLSWCGANGMYVVLDLHAAPGAQGSDTNISDALVSGGNDFWNNQINQDIAVRLWSTLSNRYKGDPRVAMYDVLNEPNNIPNTSSQNGNQRLHDVMQRFINTIRGNSDNHLILLEGNGFGNDYNWMEKRTFTNTANLVYNSHRYSGSGYEIDNNPNSVDGNNPNSLRLIGNLTRFRSDNNVPIWVGETGENSAQWMQDAANGLNSVGIGYCHWTYKRFENGANAALFHINPPYLVDGAGNIPAVLQNIKFANCVSNAGTLNAVAPNPGGAVRNTRAPIGSLITLRAVSNNAYLSGENGAQAVTCTRTAAGTWEQFAVVDAGNGKVALRSQGKYVSCENGTQAITCNRTSFGWWETFDWIVNADGTISLGGYNGRYISSENGQQAVTCNRMTISGWEAFRYTVVGTARLAAPLATAGKAELTIYPNPVVGLLTYSLPAGTQAHTLTVADATGRTVLTRSYGDTGAQNVFDASGLASGLYVVRLTGADFTQAFKVTKE
ncbi:cellulase family glycosylhydrolase [Hymenobacter cheonanensis]|uniref:cellulase family glycosylhydrolase n=1 Tax=Hymenobacter sp. CA2-7 TaxID=3063993 RepID=UPI0027129A5D|nr:cellulase family glycosylhydrolase [Hymenobacter sp. CA2-7]MDO7885570.1 cellulase family glycosylhydrolase [Hymenobacter sp. CA2-7]